MSTFDSLYDKLAGGTVGNWLAIVGLLSLLYWGWLIVAALRNRAAPDRTVTVPADATRAPAPPAAAGMPPGDLVVIAAAVHAMLGASRIVHLVADDGGRNWATQGRWMQQTSHQIR